MNSTTKNENKYIHRRHRGSLIAPFVPLNQDQRGVLMELMEDQLFLPKIPPSFRQELNRMNFIISLLFFLEMLLMFQSKVLLIYSFAFFFIFTLKTVLPHSFMFQKIIVGCFGWVAFVKIRHTLSYLMSIMAFLHSFLVIWNIVGKIHYEPLIYDYGFSISRLRITPGKYFKCPFTTPLGCLWGPDVDFNNLPEDIYTDNSALESDLDGINLLYTNKIVDVFISCNPPIGYSIQTAFFLDVSNDIKTHEAILNDWNHTRIGVSQIIFLPTGIDFDSLNLIIINLVVIILLCLFITYITKSKWMRRQLPRLQRVNSYQSLQSPAINAPLLIRSSSYGNISRPT